MSEKHLSLTPNGNILYRLKTPYRDGTRHVVFEPLDFIARLAAPGQKPRVNLARFHGVFALNNKHQALLARAKRGVANKSRVANQWSTPAERRAPMTWVHRLKRVYHVDIETCTDCGGPVKAIADTSDRCIEDPVVIEQILDHPKEMAGHQGAVLLPESCSPPQTTWAHQGRFILKAHGCCRPCRARVAQGCRFGLDESQGRDPVDLIDKAAA